jgi:hypothetical protein
MESQTSSFQILNCVRQHKRNWLYYFRLATWGARCRWVEVSGPLSLFGCGGYGCRHRGLRGRAAPRRRPCRGGHRRLAQVASVSGTGFVLLVIGNYLPPFVIPALLTFAGRSSPFRKCHMLPYLLATMVVFPLFLHIFIHVLYLTCFQHLCALAHLDRAYHVSGSDPMSPRHILPRFFFRILSPLHDLAPLLYISLHPLLWEFPTFSSTVSSDNMFREISTLRRAARHDAAFFNFPTSNR